MKTVFRRIFAPFVLAALALGTLTGCGTEVNAGPDWYVCVYDKHDALVKQIAPNSQTYRLDPEEKAVSIPASDRFYNVTVDDNTRDALAPKTYAKSFASGNVPMHIEGKTRMRFNLTKACEWYAKHGRRNANNGDLGFNARTLGEQENAGWFKWLAENFGDEMSSTTTEVVPSYTWAAMSYNYPVNANDDGTLPEGATAEEPTRDKLGREMGKKFTQNLNKSLGGEFFCGVFDEEAKEGEAGSDCPPIIFEVLDAYPHNRELMEQRQALEDTKQKIATAEQQNRLQQANQEMQLGAEETKQRLLEAEARTAEIQARIDTAKCRQLGSVGLDCEGKRPGVYGIPAPVAPNGG